MYRHFHVIKPWLVSHLQKLIHEHNSYIKDLKSAIESVPDGLQMHIGVGSTSEVALVIVGWEFDKRDIIFSFQG